MLTRREFGVCLMGLAASGGRAALVAADRSLPAWRKGELEIHLIATGRGENMLWILPDGTTVLNDCGDYMKEKYRKFIPALPDEKRSPGEYVARYVAQRIPGRTIDYLLVSHGHDDHILGIPDFMKTFSFGKVIDHQYPNRGGYQSYGEKSLEVMNALKVPAEAFRVGALDQIALLHDQQGVYKKDFHIRNLCSNLEVWTGEGEKTVDLKPYNCSRKPDFKFNQNTLSLAVRLDYGKFSYYAGGDLCWRCQDDHGKRIDYEERIGQLCGPVTVAKCNHHAHADAMSEGFVRAVRAKAWVNSVWSPTHVSDPAMSNMTSRTLYPGDRRYFPTQVPEESRRREKGKSWWLDVAADGHVVVKVAPGGADWKVYVVDARVEDGAVREIWQPKEGETK